MCTDDVAIVTMHRTHWIVWLSKGFFSLLFIDDFATRTASQRRIRHSIYGPHSGLGGRLGRGCVGVGCVGVWCGGRGVRRGWVHETQAVAIRKSSKIFLGGQRITIASKARHTLSIARCVVITLLKTIIPNPEQKTICQNKTSNAFPMVNRVYCEN